jgi:hypothetical protein
MIGTLENPTLDLDPSKPDTLNVITATRSGTATYTDANGVIQEAAADTVRVDYTQGAELTPTKFQRVGYTDFNNASQWSKNHATLTSGQLSPNGDNAATKLTATGTDPYVFASINTSAQTHTFSFYCKGEGPTIGKTARVLFWYIGGATGTTQSVDFTYSGEWQRFEFQTTPTGAGTLFYRIDVPSNTGVVGESVYIYGPQLEEGTTASDFVENTTGSPKFIASATYGPRVPMILVEPSATNLVEYSEDFSNPYWTKSAILIDSNQTEAPNGSIVADKLMEEGVNQTHLVFKAGITDLGTISVYAKQGDANNRLFQIRRDGGSNSWSWFDLQAGTVEYQTQGVASIEDAGNGWHRCTFTPTNSNGTVVFGLSNGGLTRSVAYEADGTSGVYLWGAQLETGSVATSLIPTAGGDAAARTRAADDLVISGSEFTDFFSTTENTFYCEFDPRPSDETRFLLCSQATSARFIYQPPSNNSWYIYDGTSSSVFGTESSTGLQRAAATFDGTSKEASLNGGGENTSSHNGNLLNVPTELRIGKAYYGGGYLNGHIKRVIWWPYSSDRL